MRERTYSVAVLPSREKLVVAVGDKVGHLSLWDVSAGARGVDADGDDGVEQEQDDGVFETPHVHRGCVNALQARSRARAPFTSRLPQCLPCERVWPPLSLIPRKVPAQSLSIYHPTNGAGPRNAARAGVCRRSSTRTTRRSSSP